MLYLCVHRSPQKKIKIAIGLILLLKKISDCGMIGPFGLERLYKQFFTLRKTQEWIR